MELYQLRYFLEVARQRNFTRAAAQLNLAQAALSEQIRKLEEELGAPLFHRGRRESVLTSAGETLREHAETLIEREETARAAVQELGSLQRGKLVIAAIPSVSAALLPAAIAKFRKQYPAVDLRLIEGTSEEVGQWVESGRVDFGIGQLPLPAGRFDAEVLLKEPFVAVVSGRHPLAATPLISFDQLAKESFILHQGRARESVLAACRSAGFEPNITCESREFETIRALASIGFGVAILPKLAAELASSGCVALRLRGANLERQVAIVTRTGQQLSPSADVFRKLLNASAKRVS